jgi:hypothetical protein
MHLQSTIEIKLIKIEWNLLLNYTRLINLIGIPKQICRSQFYQMEFLQ